LLVTLDPGSASSWRAVASELAALDGARVVASWFMASLGEQCLVVEAPVGLEAGELARLVRRRPRVSGASAVTQYRVLGGAAPAEDPYSHLQRFAGVLGLSVAHRHATGAGVRVAIIDTGIDVEHPDLAGSIERANDFVGKGAGFTADIHGTAVAGVVAARAGNGIGVSGVAPEAKLWALKACWQEAPGSVAAICDSYTLAQALDAALVGGVRVLNLSLEGAQDPLIERLVDEAIRRRIAVVAAAEGDPPGFPASIPGVIAVHVWAGESPVIVEERPAPRGSLVAPAIDVLTTVPRGGYDFFSGSSFAAAQASGVAALVLELRPGLTSEELGKLLLESAVPVTQVGSGRTLRRLDACAAVASVTGAADCKVEASPGDF